MQTNRIGWNFDNSYARLPRFFFTEIKPSPVRAPEVVLLDEELAAFLGLNPLALAGQEGAAVLGGNRHPPGAALLAQAYAGHQFGHFTMLGDGRAILLGEQITPAGKRFDLQLKGAGPTPYSRGGDGRAPLGPMLREYLLSAAMQALKIPTARCLAVVTTGELILRETNLPGAVLTRVAASHLRVGTFQYAAARGAAQNLKTLADYTIQRHNPELAPEPAKYRILLQKVIESQASLIAQWMLVGFVHGVMNTDNMALSGETIDYGPCAFLDAFDPDTVFSSLDQGGRYAYGRQPLMGLWNLARFAESLLPLLNKNPEKARDLAQGELLNFPKLYRKYWLEGMRAKLGLAQQKEEDEKLIEDLLELMQEHKADYTNTFLDLTFDRCSQETLFNSPKFDAWLKRRQKRLRAEPAAPWDIHQLMKDSNPALIPRNYQVEKALRAAVQENDYDPLKRLLQALKKPFAHSPDQKEYAAAPPPSALPYRTFCGT